MVISTPSVGYLSFIKTVNNIPLPIVGVWEKLIYYAR